MATKEDVESNLDSMPEFSLIAHTLECAQKIQSVKPSNLSCPSKSNNRLD